MIFRTSTSARRAAIATTIATNVPIAIFFIVACIVQIDEDYELGLVLVALMGVYGLAIGLIAAGLVYAMHQGKRWAGIVAMPLSVLYGIVEVILLGSTLNEAYGTAIALLGLGLVLYIMYIFIHYLRT